MLGCVVQLGKAQEAHLRKIEQYIDELHEYQRRGSTNCFKILKFVLNSSRNNLDKPIPSIKAE